MRRGAKNNNWLHIACVHLPLKFDNDRSYVVWMRTFLLFLPFLLLRNELLVGTWVPLCCIRDSEDVEDEKDDAGVALRLRGSELVRGPSFTFSFTLNIFQCVSHVSVLVCCFCLMLRSFSWFFSMSTSLEALFASLSCLRLHSIWGLIYGPLKSHLTSSHSMTSSNPETRHFRFACW